MDSIEEVGGKPHRAYKRLDFTSTIDICGQVESGFSGSRYTLVQQ